MDIAIDGTHELDFTSYSTSTTTTTTSSTENGGDPFKYWSDWSPVVDWEALSAHQQDDFQDLLQSVMDDGAGLINLTQSLMMTSQLETPNSVDSASSNSTDPMLTDEETSCEDLKGLRLVHLLTAAAEALTGFNKSRELARVILVRLKELVSPTDGTNMERLAAYFTDALQVLLEGGAGAGVHYHGRLITSNGSHHHHHHNRDDHQADVLSAFQLLQDMSPYVKFGHFTANQAILEAVSEDRRIHVVDFDITEGIQWASLMQALVSRKDGPPTPHLRITALSRAGNKSGRRSIGTVQETGRRLIAFAASIGQPFSFHQCRLDSDETFRPSALKLVRGEALIMNCMLHLPHFGYWAPDSIASFLSGAKTLNPRLVTLVEEEVGPTGDGDGDGGGFLGRFMDTLHHFSALSDSLEAGFPMQSRARGLVERVFLGPRIVGSLSRIYRSREREDQGCSCWGDWLPSVGFRPADLSFANHCQAKLLLGLFHDGYRLEELGCNRLVLSWKSRPLLSASIWTTSSSDSNL